MPARINTSTPSLEETGLLTIKKATPKEKSANVRVTQVHGSMEVKDVLVLATKIKEYEELREKTCKESIQKKKTIQKKYLSVVIKEAV